MNFPVKWRLKQMLARSANWNERVRGEGQWKGCWGGGVFLKLVPAILAHDASHLQTHAADAGWQHVWLVPLSPETNSRTALTGHFIRDTFTDVILQIPVGTNGCLRSGCFSALHPVGTHWLTFDLWDHDFLFSGPCPANLEMIVMWKSNFFPVVMLSLNCKKANMPLMASVLFWLISCLCWPAFN